MPSRFARSFSVSLCALHALGISAAVAISVEEIRSIVTSGIVMSIAGAVVAVTATFTRIRPTIWFGLSTPLVSLLLFTLIASLGWGPDHARVPVPWILMGYEVIAVPLGLLAIFRTLTKAHPTPPKITGQFNLRTLFGATAAVAVACVPIRWAISLGTTPTAAISVTLGIATLAGIGLTFVLAARAMRVL